ncbi:hypothetical protein PAEPH01_2504 [Pancytospora epiphaga]|nr:hypothetical protein PAEPH01_2504 [Pancytospora epiphaga]
MFRKETGTCPHCKKRSKTVDHLAMQCDRMLYHDYTRRRKEVVRCIHLGFCLKYITICIITHAFTFYLRDSNQ